MCKSARWDKRSFPIDARMQLFSRRNVLTLRSHSHDVTGIVQAIISRRMIILGKRAASQSLIATASEAGLIAVPLLRPCLQGGRVALLPG